MRNSVVKICALFAVLIFGSVALTGCASEKAAADPGLWGYECTVTYDALGGIVNAREVRTTYYMPNSYVFRPAGSSGMLVEPAKDGYILAGWYTDKADAAPGSAEEYAFAAQDRWDFYTDRVGEDMTLYARWIPRGKVSYVNADTGETVFAKNITQDSPIQPLSPSILAMNIQSGVSFEGYYLDEACVVPYDFSTYTHVEPNPSEEWLYERLLELFPQYLERTTYVAPEEEEDEAMDTSWLFLNKLGFALTTTDSDAIAQIAAEKNRLIDEAVNEYLKNTADRVIYLKFSDGRYVMVDDVSDLKRGAEYGFFDTDLAGNPIDGYTLLCDIDLSGVSITMSDSFSGTLDGGGYTISGLTVSVSSKKMDMDKEKTVGLSALMDGAVIRDITFKDAKVSVQVGSGVQVTGGLLAVNASNVSLENVFVDGLQILSGRGDDGSAVYVLGDLFGSQTGTKVSGGSAQGLVLDVRAPEKLNLSLFTR